MVHLWVEPLNQSRTECNIAVVIDVDADVFNLDDPLVFWEVYFRLEIDVGLRTKV